MQIKKVLRTLAGGQDLHKTDRQNVYLYSNRNGGKIKMKKFELTSEFITFLGRKLFRIKALVEFGDVKAGEIGGYIEKEENLSQSGNAWVYGDAQVSGDAWVSGNARVYKDLDFATVGGFGSEQRTTTFFRQQDGSI